MITMMTREEFTLADYEGLKKALARDAKKRNPSTIAEWLEKGFMKLFRWTAEDGTRFGLIFEFDQGPPSQLIIAYGWGKNLHKHREAMHREIVEFAKQRGIEYLGMTFHSLAAMRQVPWAKLAYVYGIEKVE